MTYNRNVSYAKQYVDPNEPGVLWDYYWDGNGTPSNIETNNMAWDSNADDDFGYHLARPIGYRVGSYGEYTADRVTNTATHNLTGNIWTGDLSMSSAYGMTLEFRIKLFPNSNTDGVSITYKDDAGAYGMHLSPDRVTWGRETYAARPNDNQRNYDFTGGFNTIRILRHPGSATFSWYLNGQGPFEGAMNTQPYADYRAFWNDTFRPYPQILIGDNSNDLSVNGHYALDYVKYRRGVVPPGQSPALATKTIPALPRPASSAAAEAPLWNGPTRLSDMTSAPSVYDLRGAWTTDADTGAMKIDGGSRNVFIGTAFGTNVGVAGLTNGRSFTIEADVRVLPTSDDDAFVLEYGDIKGSAEIVFAKDGIWHAHSNSRMDARVVRADMTDGFHKVRVVRKCDIPTEVQCNLLYLYLDGQLVGADLKINGQVFDYPRLSFGDLAYPTEEPQPRVLIRSVRWHAGASAPPLSGSNNTTIEPLTPPAVVTPPASTTAVTSGSCALDGVTVADGQSRSFYSVTNPAPGQLCSTYSYARSCTNGALSPETAYRYANCTQTNLSNSVSFSTDKASYALGEQLTVSWTNSAPASGQWVGVFPSGATYPNYVTWFNAGSGQTGSYQYSAIGSGSYDLVLLSSTNAEIYRKPIAFAVTTPVAAQISLTTNSVSYALGSPVTVTWSSNVAKAGDWIAVFGTGKQYPDYLTWFSTNGLASGSHTFNAIGSGLVDLAYFNASNAEVKRQSGATTIQ